MMDKHPAWFYKTFVVGVIFLFIGVGAQPTIANEVSINQETKENADESKSSDEYQEIITYVYGIADINWIKRRGIFRGELETNQENIVVISLKGLRLSNSGVEKYNITEVGYVHAPRFIGVSIINPLLVWPNTIIGLAFGNIEWELIEYARNNL